MTGLSRRRVLALTLPALLFPALALNLAPHSARAQSAAAAPIVQLDSALLDTMRQGKAGVPFPQRFAALAPAVQQALDLRAILQRSVGPSWSDMSAAEQAELLQAFQRFTVASYVANFNSYGGQRFELLPDTRAIGADQIVGTRLVEFDGTGTRLDYVMHQDAGGWKAIDVLLDGTISRVTVQRSDFRGLLGSGGAAALIASLRQKTAKLSGGTLG